VTPIKSDHAGLVPSACLWLLASLLAPSVAGQATPPLWYKGNTHTHTLNSDGDSTPEEVVRWYREHRYHFLVLSDHNFLTSVDGLNALHGADGRFLVIPGEEVTDRFGDKPLHVNGLNLRTLVEPQGGGSVAEVLQRDVDAIRRVEGIPHINHPNFGWAIAPADLEAVHHYRLFEIFNGHPEVNNDGGADAPGLEEMWDRLLGAGKLVYGIAVDDAHHFKRAGDADASGPGRGWVMVRAPALTADAILGAMEAGQFYASTGVELEDVAVGDGELRVRVKARGATRVRIQFVGEGGRVLRESAGPEASYRLGGERYVRARVLDSNGRKAWVQPVFARQAASSGRGD
jgi:hypothetical protein